MALRIVKPPKLKKAALTPQERKATSQWKRAATAVRGDEIATPTGPRAVKGKRKAPVAVTPEQAALHARGGEMVARAQEERKVRNRAEAARKGALTRARNGK